MTEAEKAAEKKAKQRRKDKEADKALKAYLPKFASRMKRLAITSQVKTNHDVILSVVPLLVEQSRMRREWIELALESLGHTPAKTSAWSKQNLVLVQAMIDGPKGTAILDRLFRILIWNQLIKWPGRTDSKFKAAIEKADLRITSTTPKDYALGFDPGDEGHSNGFDMILDTIIKATDVSLVGCWAEGVEPGPQRELILELSPSASHMSLKVAHGKYDSTLVTVNIDADTSKTDSLHFRQFPFILCGDDGQTVFSADHRVRRFVSGTSEVVTGWSDNVTYTERRSSLAASALRCSSNSSTKLRSSSSPAQNASCNLFIASSYVLRMIASSSKPATSSSPLLSPFASRTAIGRTILPDVSSLQLHAS